MRFGLPISLFMHLSFLFGGLLVWTSSTVPLDDVRIIPLDLVTVSDVTNIKATRKEPDPIEPEPEDVEINDPETIPDKPEEIPTESPDGELLADEAPEEKPNVEPEAQSMDDFLNSFSKSVKQAREDNPDVSQQAVLGSEIADRDVQGVGDQTGNTVDPIQYMQARMANCYKIDTGAKDYQDLRVETRVNLNREAEIIDIKIRNEMQILASSNNSWRAARDNVIFALNECAPYKKLLNADYNTWKTLDLNFQPNDES